MAEARTLLTVIITTSVTPTAPSTELISTALESFRSFCPDLLTCNLIVVFDGYDEIQSTPRLKKGRVTPEQAKSYGIYKTNVKNLILKQYGKHEPHATFVHSEGEAEFGGLRTGPNTVQFTTSVTLDKTVSFIEPSKRIGFGLAVRTALRMTDTPYVWVHQHDWVLSADIPLEALLDVMQASSAEPERPVKYVCLPSPRNLSYDTCAEVVDFPTLKTLTASLKAEFSPKRYPDVKIALTPLFHWLDKPHIASKVHYLERVFPSRLSMLRGDFIEDKIGHVCRTQMKDGQWPKWATWLYYPGEGQTPCVTHLHGRVWVGKEAEDKKIAELRSKGLAQAPKQDPKPEPVYDTAIFQQDSEE
ncbi:unnamed protein product [Clonostachys solani]|uniref:Uncharacterized protein n=1 Tax=Clonostachys solani TaxID=160281 RepID=A0A9N9ZNW9_9HYPO|nr:unnamed protein product [Clonostachys solani]